MKKGLLEETASFLRYLEKSDLEPEKRQKKVFENKKWQDEKFRRILEISTKEKYFSEERENTFYSKDYEEDGKKIHESGVSGIYDTYRITTEGLKFLEERQKEREQNRKIDTQNKLTAGLFTIAFLQSIISIVYYFFDLQVRGFILQSNIFVWGSIIILIGFFLILIKAKI